METLICESYKAYMGTAREYMECSRNTRADYLIATTHFTKTEEIAWLVNSGFRFHDRYLQMEIRVGNTTDRTNLRPGVTNGILVEETHAFTEEMLEVACASFETDRRFHLELAFDPRMAREAIEAVTAKAVHEGVRIFAARHGSKVLGCILIREPESGVWENILGFTRRDILGKAAAWPLYAGTLKSMGKGYRYTGMVSSSNSASINLHARLGAKVSAVEDRYILCQRKQKIR